MTVEAVAKVTKIQPRILERLEAGKFDGLPAEVFVRGFVRSFARCVGLDEVEALERYNLIVASGGKDASPTARALVDSMSDLAPRAASRATGPVMLVQAPIEVVEIPPAPDVVETVRLPETGTLMELTTIPASSMDEVKIDDITAAAAEPEPVVAEPVVAAAEAAPAPKGKKKRARGGKRKSIATGTPSEATPIVAAAVDDVAIITTAAVTAPVSSPERPIIGDVDPAIAAIVVAPPIVESPAIEAAPVVELAVDVVIDEPTRTIDTEAAATEMWAPKMPPLATASVPWRRPTMTSTAAPIVPSLVIDDAAPEYAERVLEDRAAAKVSTTNAQRRSFLPPILLDREDRSARQGGLTLAVILLLIAATITLSYLMRRPSSSGDGITQADAPTHFVG
jgi:hypothetical protein